MVLPPFFVEEVVGKQAPLLGNERAVRLQAQVERGVLRTDIQATTVEPGDSSTVAARLLMDFLDGLIQRRHS